MLFGFVICLLFTIGDIDQVVNSPTGLPLIEVYYQATKSVPATNFLVIMPALMLCFGQFNDYASVSRLVWQFSKDNGLPFSNFFSRVSVFLRGALTILLNSLMQVHPKLKLPLNALALVSITSFIISIFYVISTTAFNAIISLATISLTFSYFPPIFFVTVQKLRGNPPQYGPFKLGRYGVLVNILALLYLVFVITWMPFPTNLPVTASNMNYAGPLLGAVIIGALLDWIISGRKRFQMPVAPMALRE